jgi:phospholipase/carboxylesterase
MPEMDGPRWGPAAGGAPQQLVVLCHGVGADGNDLIDLAPGWGKALPHALFLSPHAPFPCDMAPMGRQWFSLSDRTPARMEQGVRIAAAELGRFIDQQLAAQRLPPTAYALMGFSQGAMTVLFAGLRRAAAPRAILGYAGALLGAESLPAELANRAPVLLCHGEDDQVVPAAASRQAERVLRALDVPVETVFTPKLEHGIAPAGIATGALFLQRAFATDGSAEV